MCSAPIILLVFSNFSKVSFCHLSPQPKSAFGRLRWAFSEGHSRVTSLLLILVQKLVVLRLQLIEFLNADVDFP